MTWSEREHIAWIRHQIAERPDVLVGIGDDVAVLRSGDPNLLVTVDMLLEGVHFDLSQCSPRQVGWKAMAVNLSDIAAMAGRPTAAVVAVGLPGGEGGAVAEALFQGLHQAAEAYGVALVGGDTNRSRGGLVLSVTLLGTPTGNGPVLRSGGQPGDVLCVTGPLGYSLDGKHLDFRPRVAEAQALHEHFHLHAMMDLSDGLGSDLFLLAEASDCGAIVEATAIPIRTPRVEFPNDERSPLDHALHDGEDFELLFALSPQEADRLTRMEHGLDLGCTIHRIGWLTADRSILLRDDGRDHRFPRGGYTHKA